MAYSLVYILATSTLARPNQGEIHPRGKTLMLPATAKNRQFIASARARSSGSVNHYLKMGLSRKRKKQLREIINRSLESRKLRKVDQENH